MMPYLIKLFPFEGGGKKIEILHFLSKSYHSKPFSFSYLSIKFCSDLYEGTRMAQVTDIAGIKQIIQPLEASGILVKRTDEEVYLAAPSTYLQ